MEAAGDAEIAKLKVHTMAIGGKELPHVLDTNMQADDGEAVALWFNHHG